MSLNSQITNVGTLWGELIQSGLTKSLDIHSPSRRTYWFGEMTGAGLVEGGESKMGAIENTALRMAQAILPNGGKVNVGVNSGSTTNRGGDTYNFNIQSNATDTNAASRDFARQIRFAR